MFTRVNMLLLVSCGVLALAVLACTAHHPAPAPRGLAPPGPRTFDLIVVPPRQGTVGQELVATVRVTPRGVYKINLEYPHKLEVTGPGAATPPQATWTSSRASQLTASALEFRPAFRLSLPGTHTFTGTLRFSVCTERLCEMKSERVQWQATVAEQWQAK